MPSFLSLALCSAAVGVGFYGNSETNDGVYQLTYSLYNTNHTLGGVDSLVGSTAVSILYYLYVSHYLYVTTILPYTT